MANPGVVAFRTVSFYVVLTRQQLDWDKCTEIVEGLFISSMPVKRTPCGRSPRFTNTLQQLAYFILSKNPNRPLRYILSTQEADEIQGRGFIAVETISENDINSYNENHLETSIQRDPLSICDYDSEAKLNLENAAEKLQKIHRVRQESGSVVVHCKAGCERSALTCIAYLASYVMNPATKINYTVDEALDLMKTKRKQVRVTGGKLLQAKKIVEYVTGKAVVDKPRSYSQIISNFWDSHKNKIISSGIALTAATFSAYRL